MSRKPTIRVKSTNPEDHDGFLIRNADDLRYGEELFMAEEFESIGEHAVKLKIASLSSDDPFVIEGNLWLGLKEQWRSASDKANRSAREADTLAIAKEANRLASEANSIARLEAAASARSSRYAMYAAIIAATIMLADRKDQILALISYP